MMKLVTVRSFKGQMKIQEMAFVLVAIMVFFGIVALVFLVIRLSGLENSVEDLNNAQAKEIVRKIASEPEFDYDGVCEECIDLDKIMILKERQSYKDFWSLDYLVIERVYPRYESEECNRFNYPKCNRISILNISDFGNPSYSFVALCRIDNEEGYTKCELGKIYASEVKDE